MRLSLFPLSLAFSLLVSCNQGGKNTRNPDSQPDKAVKPTSQSNCYRYAGANDTITLNLIHTGDSITGTLVYNFKEKDDNSGILNGSMKGNILVAEYTFLSEGVQSVRQVAFKLEDTAVIRNLQNPDLISCMQLSLDNMGFVQPGTGGECCGIQAGYSRQPLGRCMN